MNAPPDTDRAYLERAAELGRRGWGRVHPNPMVGCVLVRNGEVLAEAYHRDFGGPHAEALALEAAGGSVPGATAYVSLEPCRHQGKTPACTAALIRAGVQRVVFGASDPTAAAGGGAGALRDAGIEVVGPVFGQRRARLENPAFHHAAAHDTPWVALKLAVSLDGRIAAAPGVRTRLTGPEADREVQRLRAGFDAILVGGGTARADDPLLTVREAVPPRRPPTRIVLDSEARLSPDAALFRDVEEAPLAIFTRVDAPEDAMERLEEAGARIHPVPPAPEGPGLDLDAVLRICHDTGVRSVFCEGGGTLAGALLRADYIERLYLFVTPYVLGERGVPAFRGAATTRGGGADAPPGGRRWAATGEPRAFGDDRLLTYDRDEDTRPDPPASEA